MTLQETQRIVTTIAAMFPTFKVEDKSTTLEAWNWALQDYSYNDVSQALNLYIKTSSNNFAPAVSQLIGLIRKEDDFKYPSEDEAWSMVRRACEKLDWNDPAKEYNKLPDIIQRTIVIPGNLKEWAMLDMDDFETVISSNFKRSYRAAIEQSKELNKMPADVRERVESARKKMLIEGGLYAGDNDRKQLVDSSGEVPEEIRGIRQEDRDVSGDGGYTPRTEEHIRGCITRLQRGVEGNGI